MRIAGVPLNITPSAVLYAVLAAWTGFAMVAFGTGWAIAAAAGSVLVVLGSFLLNGLAHLAGVRRAGLHPTGLHLVCFGGVATIAEDERDVPARIVERLDAIGPLVSAALSLGAYLALGYPSAEPPVPHSAAEGIGIVLLRIAGLFNALALVANVLLLVVVIVRRRLSLRHG